ncbi:MAG: hypothetical protein ACLVLI_04120 [Aedoeadaptatus pacaensis]
MRKSTAREFIFPVVVNLIAYCFEPRPHLIKLLFVTAAIGSCGTVIFLRFIF